MKRAVLILFLVALFANTSKASGKPVVSLLTCGSGNELYSTFGHSALRLYYPNEGKDLVFNFGLFNFNTPAFYWKFMRGKLEYMLGIQYMDDFIAQYKWEERWVKEQVLDLDSMQTARLVDRLEFLYLPANRYYLYSFLYKNCTSELRDIIFPLVEGAESSFKNSMAGVTDRELINGYISGWPKFGINLILGSGLDKEISVYQSMFLPDNLYSGISVLQNGGKSLVSRDHYLYKAGNSNIEKRDLPDYAISPLFVFVVLLLLVLVGLFKKRFGLIFSNIYLVLVSILGIVLSFIILVTEHKELYMNFNLLWCNPFFLAVVYASVMGLKKTERLLSAISLFFLALLQLVWAFEVQYAEPGFVVIVITLAIVFLSRVFTPFRVQKQMSYGSR
ncbi:MAG: DUF4105 domain-containing protein [Bacteroidales bacterium]|nr:DUF4105 domain-containing protein [Bacteroidales bacterium]